jgi:uncharacterized membrane protein YhaH (DUF805 family)
MNPLRWPREHQLAWLIICVLGAVLGFFLGFVLWENRRYGFGDWIGSPDEYRPWLVFGAAVAGITFYALRLLITRPAASTGNYVPIGDGESSYRGRTEVPMNASSGRFQAWVMLAVSFFFSFRGRIGCSIYWLILVSYLASLWVMVAVSDRLAADIGSLVALAVIIPFGISYVSACVRRLHDLNYSGWWTFLLLTPLIGGFGILYLGIKHGDKAANRFGAPPAV